MVIGRRPQVPASVLAISQKLFTQLNIICLVRQQAGWFCGNPGSLFIEIAEEQHCVAPNWLSVRDSKLVSIEGFDSKYSNAHGACGAGSLPAVASIKPAFYWVTVQRPAAGRRYLAKRR
jgi:hypothetical protein